MVQLNFDSPEWPAIRDQLAVKVDKLGTLLAEETRLTELRKLYRNQPTMVLCTGAKLDDHNHPRIINDVVISGDDAIMFATRVIDEQIGRARQRIEQLLSEIAG